MTNAPVRAFRALCDRYIGTVAEIFPETASLWGLPGYDGALGDNDLRAHRRFGAVLKKMLAECEALPAQDFRGDDWLDRRGFLSMLRTELWDTAVRRSWQINPQVHADTAFSAILIPVIRAGSDLRKIETGIRERLAQIPRFLQAGLSCIERPVPLWTALAVESCSGARAFFDGLKPRLPGIAPELFDGASDAFEAYGRGVARKKEGPAAGFAVGRSAFEMLIREKLGLDWSAPEAMATGLDLVARIGEALRVEARKLGSSNARDLIERAAAGWDPGPDLLGRYRTMTAEVRGRFLAKGLVTLPDGERLKILQVPDFLRHQFPTAAYHAPPPFGQAQTGVFWVNDLSATARTSKRRAAEIRQHFGLELTCAHEAYPGHHLQFFVQNRHPSRIRRLMGHAIFYEGWTLWCEKMCVEEGIWDAPYARLMQLHDALWRAHRIVIDCGIHAMGMTLAAARKRLVEGVGFTPARARGDLNWYTAAPSVPMSYLLGRLELERVWAGKRAEGWGIRRFNDWALSHGAVPWTWIERAGSPRGKRTISSDF